MGWRRRGWSGTWSGAARSAWRRRRPAEACGRGAWLDRLVPKPAGESSQRRRLLNGMIGAAARYGLGEASVARVIREAGVSRATFYEHFADRDDCFLAAHRLVAEGIEEIVAQNIERPPAEMLAALLRAADRNPAAARVGLIEGLAGDAAVRRQFEELLDRLGGRPRNQPAHPPRTRP